MHPQLNPTNQHRAASAFTLMEMLVAIGIFAIGFVAIASLFPPALVLQKRAFDQADADAFVSTTRDLINTVGFDRGEVLHFGSDQGGATDVAFSDLRGPRDLRNSNATGQVYSGYVTPVPEALQRFDSSNYAAPYDGTYIRYGLSDRSGPSHEPMSERHFFWTPLFQNTASITSNNVTTLRAFVFVLNRHIGDGISHPRNAAELWAMPTLLDGDLESGLEGFDQTFDGPASTDDVPGVAFLPATASSLTRIEFENLYAGELIARVGHKVLVECNPDINDANNHAKTDIVTVTGAGEGHIEVAGIASRNIAGIWVAFPDSQGNPTFVDLMSFGEDVFK